MPPFPALPLLREPNIFDNERSQSKVCKAKGVLWNARNNSASWGCLPRTRPSEEHRDVCVYHPWIGKGRRRPVPTVFRAGLCLQVDLSNAFEDGKTCLERLEDRRKAGKVSEGEEASVMEALKERIRGEYRKVKVTVNVGCGRCAWALAHTHFVENRTPAAFNVCLYVEWFVRKSSCLHARRECSLVERILGACRQSERATCKVRPSRRCFGRSCRRTDVR